MFVLEEGIIKMFLFAVNNTSRRHWIDVESSIGSAYEVVMNPANVECRSLVVCCERSVNKKSDKCFIVVPCCEFLKFLYC